MVNAVDDTREEASVNGVAKSNLLIHPHTTTLAFLESLSIPLVQEVVISADIGCIQCQKRICNVISRFNGEMESVVVNISEKKVIVICKYLTLPATQITTARRRIINKVAFIKRIFGPSRH